jgi:omega-6 fatty acid desaturase (delta-12 desaturase)
VEAAMNTEKFRWQAIVAQYAQSNLRQSVWQATNTLIPYFGLFYLAMRSMEVSIWLTLPLSILTAGFMVRTFIIFHDCGHGSFFKSKTANTWLGRVTGLLTFTPYYRWSHDHAIHHATAGDLDRRGTGDVYTMTVEEYLSAPWWKRFGYRVMRNPIAMFVFGSLIVFVITQRIPTKGRREQASVWWTNLSLVVMITAMCLLFGWKEYLFVQFLVMFFGASTGIWLFYVQHNFEGVYWDRHAQWDYFKASMQGSSFYKLPAVLNWFSGNIGYHHIHHLSAKIPNYNLPKAYKENPVFHVKPITLLSSLKSLKWRLYDEASRRLTGWEVLKKSSLKR